MFNKPHEHLIIAITKTRLVDNHFDLDELVDVAKGENGENISFEGYDVTLVE